jgi:hypothetical protein
MAENENSATEEQSGNGGNATRTAMKAAAAAAATGAAAVAVKKALSSGSGSNGSDNGDSKDKKKSGNTQSLVMSVASGSWDAAQDAIVPLAGDAAAAAGKYLAANGPDVVKEQIVPRFIEAFNEAS